MRLWVAMLLLALLTLTGCAGNKVVSKPGSFANLYGPQKLIVTPEVRLVGKVVRVNSPGRFAVLNFPIGHLPATDQRLNVYRQGLKIGEIKVTQWQMDDMVVADIVAGEAQPGDDVRDW